MWTDRPPGPIAGRWRVTCPDSDGMILDISVKSPTSATGKVAEPGAAAKFGYKAGEVMLKLDADSYGDWVGQVEWRGLVSAPHWDGIRLRASADGLDGVMANEECYRKMPRAR
jgi:hypothetical protein